MSATARWLLGTTLVGLIVVGGLVVWLWPVLAMLGDPGRTGNYRFGSESMLPTLVPRDVVRPIRTGDDALRRGTVIVFRGPDTTRIARIVGLSGDLVAVKAGRVFINGEAAALRKSGPGPRHADGTATRVQLEQLPKTPMTHRLLDAGESVGDDFAPVRVPIGHLFVMGDNRDRAADSRFPLDEMGAGFVPNRNVIGRVDRVLWSASFGNRAKAIDAPEDRRTGFL